ncbi:MULTISPECIES: ISL3 family transposase [unclassified Streptomyces]|uniref:ISL3 family transposase n=1 Tax=unclassified Streptomyces TaxID=2593676 RepID=UPI001BEB70BB|nr:MULTISPECIES: ISL3 family transposase [unclassified Streptomyces]MBT2407637.1 ISL3 family transposase [Streptomyces sp. ISL-21]MBT2611631.1 ISL3 family transposase [Streptomyces sp. ISL-87]
MSTWQDACSCDYNLLTVFSHLAPVTVEGVTTDDDAVILTAQTTTREAVCPGCGEVSSRVHGGYRRHLADLAVAGRRVIIDLAVRRFRCPASACGRRTFVEQIGGLTERFARRTPALRLALERIALALAGRPAARLATHLSIPLSANSLLRLLRKLPDKKPSTAPRVMGVDDFALKKGHVYGTIIMNMETGERVDVLPDRTSQTLVAWLRDHPGAEIVCRDRASAYAEAVRTACPDAIQVADRHHLWMNLCEAVEKCVAVHRGCLAERADETATDAPVVPVPGGVAVEAPAATEGLRVIKRRERHAAVHDLYDKGVQIQVIAETLGLDRKTVHRYAHAATPDDASLATGSRSYGQIHAYTPYLYQRWNEGCTDAARLHAEITERGYRGSKRTVRRHLQQIRADGTPAPDKPQELTVRKATWLITAHPDKINESKALKLKQLFARCPELEAVAACVRAFARMMTERRGEELDQWLTQVENAGLKPLLSLARGLRQDFDAVTAGLTLEWNSGPVEGNVNRVKRIKRDGYGRAGFDLLRRQILLAD